MMGLEGRREEGPLQRLRGAAGAAEPAHRTYRASSARRLRRARRGSPPGRELWQCGCRRARASRGPGCAGKDSPTPAREPAPPWSQRPGGDRGRARAARASGPAGPRAPRRDRRALRPPSPVPKAFPGSCPPGVGSALRPSRARAPRRPSISRPRPRSPLTCAGLA